MERQKGEHISGTEYSAPEYLSAAHLPAHDPSHAPTGSWHIVLPGTPDSLPHIRQMIQEATEHCGFSEEETAKIEMAVDEACTNVIEHAYHAMSPDSAQALEIEVLVHGYPDRLEITILDRSPQNFPISEDSGIDVDHYLAEQRRRGLGLFIIRSFVDDVKHRFIDGRGNELLLVKYFA